VFELTIPKAGFPPGVINILSGAGSVGALLASHMSIAKIAFTGSEAGGRAVMGAAAKSNLKIVSLELGGKSPALIFDDADIDNAVTHNSINFLRNSGQICFAASRVLVQEGIAQDFIKAVRTAFEDAADKMGDPSVDSTVFGPLADKKQFDRVMEFLAEGKKQGVEFIAGGERKGDKGTFVLPTIMLNPDVKSRVYTDEIFGPVISIRTFKSEDEAIELANNTSYGLGSTVFTADVARALRVAGKLEAGTVGINSAFATSQQTPFGKSFPHSATLLRSSLTLTSCRRRTQAKWHWSGERGRWPEGLCAAEDHSYQYECASTCEEVMLGGQAANIN